jgi:hypothetical protein
MWITAAVQPAGSAQGNSRGESGSRRNAPIEPLQQIGEVLRYRIKLGIAQELAQPIADPRHLSMAGGNRSEVAATRRCEPGSEVFRLAHDEARSISENPDPIKFRKS